MPVYEYKCEVCGGETEIDQHVDDPPPNCNHEDPSCQLWTPMKKQISKSTFQLKGSRWAKEGY